MLKQRVLTALILAPLAIWAIMALPDDGFAALFGLIILLGAWEWTRLVGIASTAGRLAYGAGVGALMAGLYPVLELPGSIIAVATIGLIWWLAALVSVVSFPGSTGLWRASRAARALAGLLVLVPAWGCVVLLQQVSGPGFVLLLMVLIWGADTGAYFSGRRWGRHRLAPNVSPGKTWEGVGGGAVVALGAGAAGWLLLQPAFSLVPFIAVCALTIAFSVLGDLSESMFKRMMDVKDSGGLLPGHGGILDRIDSLTAAAPMFALGLYGLGSVA